MTRPRCFPDYANPVELTVPAFLNGLEGTATYRFPGIRRVEPFVNNHPVPLTADGASSKQLGKRARRRLAARSRAV